MFNLWDVMHMLCEVFRMYRPMTNCRATMMIHLKKNKKILTADGIKAVCSEGC